MASSIRFTYTSISVSKKKMSSSRKPPIFSVLKFIVQPKGVCKCSKKIELRKHYKPHII